MPGVSRFRVSLVKNVVNFAQGKACSEHSIGGVLIRPVALSLSKLFRAGSIIDRWLVQGFEWQPTKRLPCPVISVGNLTWGGTGKTPMVEFLAKVVLQHGHVPVVVTRGYGNDETHQLRARLPAAATVLVGRDRYEVVQEYFRTTVPSQDAKKTVVILDDGFQGWALSRDLNIVMMDAASPFGNVNGGLGRIIPAGILREPPSELKRADVIVLHNAELENPERLRKSKELVSKAMPKKNIMVLASFFQPTHLSSLHSSEELSLDELREYKKIVALSALGNSNTFIGHVKKYLAGFDTEVVDASFPDHYPFHEDDIRDMLQLPDCSDNCVFVTTEKDASRRTTMQNATADSDHHSTLFEAMEAVQRGHWKVYILHGNLRLASDGYHQVTPLIVKAITRNTK